MKYVTFCEAADFSRAPTLLHRSKAFDLRRSLLQHLTETSTPAKQASESHADDVQQQHDNARRSSRKQSATAAEPKSPPKKAKQDKKDQKKKKKKRSKPKETSSPSTPVSAQPTAPPSAAAGAPPLPQPVIAPMPVTQLYGSQLMYAPTVQVQASRLAHLEAVHRRIERLQNTIRCTGCLKSHESPSQTQCNCMCHHLLHTDFDN